MWLWDNIRHEILSGCSFLKRNTAAASIGRHASMPFKAGNMLAVFALLKRSKEPLSAEELMQRINNGEPSDIDDDFNRPVTSDSDLMLDKLEESGLIMKAFMSSGVPDWNSVFKYFAYSEGYGMPIQFYAPACLGERDEQ